MKELTIEEKAKAYDEATKRAKELLEIGVKDTRDKRVVLSFFPELKESEDERMVKFIKQQLFKIKETITENYELDAKLTKAIDWLEKQCEKGTNGNEREIPNSEQKPTDKFPKYDKGDILTDGKNKYEVLSWDYTETGIAAYYMKGVGCKFSWNCEEADKKLYIVEQKPAWSKKDEQNLNAALGYINDEYLCRWLKDVIYNKYEKSSWSKEEQQIIEDAACCILDCVNTAETKEEEERLEELADKLQNLRPQWKPSEEQIKGRYNHTKSVRE